MFMMNTDELMYLPYDDWHYNQQRGEFPHRTQPPQRTKTKSDGMTMMMMKLPILPCAEKRES